jgi:hypothetical protein
MSLIKRLIITAVLAGAASSAMAAPPRLSDVQYIAANRCLGLMTSSALASADAGALKAYLDQQSRARMEIVADRADEARDLARTEANRAGGARRDALVAERDGACRAYLAPTSEAGGGARGIRQASPPPR